MKNIYSLIIALFAFVATTQAQVTIYHENFSAPVAGITSQPANEWVASSANPSNIVQASGGAHYRTSTTTADGSRTKSLYLDNEISTIGYQNIKISWLGYRSFMNNGNSAQMNGAALRLYYSVNNGAYVEVTGFAQATQNNVWAKVNNGNDIVLPAACSNARSLRFFWSFTNNNKFGDYYAIDDITITGTPEEGVSTLDWNTYPKNDNPFAAGKVYTVDGRKVTFSRTLSAGVEMPTARVTDSLFQTSAKTLTLVQRKATATAGSVITIKFDEPVTDLTFKLFDVDQSQNQFQDRLFITGKNFMNATVALQKSKVITSSKNQFTANTSELRGVSGSDVAANSTDGNISITFGVPVVEVSIVYNNTEAIRNSDGQQGIAIHNLTWRKEMPISTLPVSLVSFKGTMQGGATKLSWNTASESDNDKFVVERSLDGKSYKAVGEVKGRGNSSVMQYYTFTDNAPAAGTNYYRLKQVDFDGTFEYSKTVAVSFASLATSSVYPTLASETITVKLATPEGQANVYISDVSGRQITTVQNTNERLLTMPVQHLQSGIYFVTIADGVQKETIRFVKK